MIRSVLVVFATIVISVGSAVAAEFNHAEHLTYLEAVDDCTACHLPGAASITPADTVCQKCHDAAFVSQVTMPGLRTHGPAWSLNHGAAAAKVEAMDCGSCHQQVDCLECHAAGFANEMGSFGNAMTNVHRSDFHVTHPIAARTDPQRCATCHETRFCSDCHDEFAPADLAILSHRRGWSDLSVTAAPHSSFSEAMCKACHIDSVLPRHEWSDSHAREARKNLATCQACHPDGDVCMTCHSAVTGLGVNPHPKDWDDIKDRLRAASNGRTCRKCH